jgi:O-antigen ligase
MINNNPINTITTRFWPDKISLLLEKISVTAAIAFAFALPISTTATTLLQIISIITYIAAGNLKQKFLTILQCKTALLFFALYGLFVIGTIYSTAPLQDSIHMLNKYSKILLAILMLPIYTNPACRRHSLNAFLAAIVLTLFLSYLKLFGLFHYRPELGTGSVFKNHIQTSFLMVMGFYLVCYRFFTTSNNFRWIYGVLILFTAYNILFVSMGRTGYVIFLVAVILLGYQLTKGKGKGIAISLVIAIFLAGFALSFSHVFKNNLHKTYQNINNYTPHSQHKTSIGLRISFAKESLGLIKKHPLFGTGTGSLSQQIADIKPKPLALTHNPHNEYLNIGVQLGLVGIALFLIILFYGLKEANKLAPAMKHFAQAVICVIAVGSLANSWLMDTTEGHFFTCFLMLALASNITLTAGFQRERHNLKPAND